MNDPHVATQRRIGPPAEHVYRLIADFRAHHPHFLPPAFSDFEVEQGGIEAGTVHSFKLTAGGWTRSCRMRVEEPEPGRVLTESDQLSSAVTTFTVTPEGPGCRCGSRAAGRAPPAWVACSSGCLRRGCCAGPTPTNSSGWIATLAAAPN